MLLPVIAIDFGAPPPQSVAMDQALRACSLSLPQGVCIDSRSTGADSAPVKARVTWLDQRHGSVLVEVAPTAIRGSDVELQRLDFAAQDPMRARWEAIGLAIGTLAEPPEEPIRVAPTSAAPAPVPLPQPVAAPWRGWWLSLRASYGTGLDDDDSATGIEFGAAYAIQHIPLTPVVTLHSREATASGMSARWQELGLGLGTFLTTGAVRLRASAQLVAQSFEVASHSIATGREDRGTQDTLGIAFEGSLSWPSEGRGALSLGARVLSLRHPTTVRVGRQPAAENPEQAISGYAGLEVRF